MGMSYEEYWNGDPILVRAYRKADRLRQRRDNQNAWLIGSYIYEAISDLSPIFNVFSKRSPKPYLDKPYELRFDKKDDQDYREEQERRKVENNMINLQSWAARHNQKLKGGK